MGPAVLVVLLTLAVFLPAVGGGFVNWDDDVLLLGNVRYREPGWAAVRWAWSASLLGHWMPLTWLSYTLDARLWGAWAGGYHLTSVVLHALGAGAVYGLARRLLVISTGDGGGRASVTAGAVTAALLFALHPQRVEAVAWASARSVVLGGLLLVLAALAWLEGARRTDPVSGRPASGWQGLALVLFGLSLLARSSGLVLPAVLLLLDVFPLGRLGPGRWLGPGAWPVWREKLAFALVGLAILPAEWLARVGHRGGAPSAPGGLGGVLAGALSGTALQVGKTLWPVGLAPLYETASVLDGRALASGAALAAVTAGAWLGRRRWPAVTVAWLGYLILLAPVAGLVPGGRLRGPADRYTYLASVGLAIVGGAAVAAWLRPGRGRRACRALVACVVVVVTLAALALASRRQLAVWADGRRLWGAAVRSAPASGAAHNNLGVALEAAGDLPGAAVHYREALARFGDHPGARLNLGRVLVAQGRAAEGTEEFRRALTHSPGLVEARVSLGAALVQAGDLTGGVRELAAALVQDPGSALAHYHLAVARSRQGQVEAARTHFREALRLRPDLGPASAGLADLDQRAGGRRTEPPPR